METQVVPNQADPESGYHEWLKARDAMAARNRAVLARAKASGADTWLREAFVYAEDGTTEIVAQPVPVPAPDPDEPVGWTMKFIDDGGNTYYDHEARHRADAYWAACERRPARGRSPRPARNQRFRGSRRGSRAAASSSDDPDPDPAPAERRCRNARCGADLSDTPRSGPPRDYCDKACKQQAYRDRLTARHLDDLVGTSTNEVSCRCEPKGHLVIGGVCHPCGRPRGAVTRAWLDDEGVPARSFVVTPDSPDSWRVRPDRKLSAKLRRTRGRWDEREAVAA